MTAPLWKLGQKVSLHLDFLTSHSHFCPASASRVLLLESSYRTYDDFTMRHGLQWLTPRRHDTTVSESRKSHLLYAVIKFHMPVEIKRVLLSRRLAGCVTNAATAHAELLQ